MKENGLWVIKKKDMDSLVEELKKDGEVYGVKPKEIRYLFDKLDKFEDPGDRYIPTLIPPKKYIFPKQETLFKFKLKDAISVEETAEARPQVLLGVRPCDINAINLLDKIFGEANQDANYLKKRAATTIIGIECNSHCDKSSFCNSVAALEANEGYDVMLTDIGDSFVGRAATDRGKSIIKKAREFKKATEGASNKYEKALVKRRKAFENRLNINEPKELPMLLKANDNHPHWEEIGKICLGCGACVLVCPTCYCFDVFDTLDLNLESGRRDRIWDGCVLHDFAVVAGGENFREGKSSRLRHRWNRKFNYLFTKWGRSNCVGCGRCIRACLVNISPVTIVNTLAMKGPLKVEI